MIRLASHFRAPAAGAGPAVHHDLLVDAQGRRLDYLRLAVTDRCNLRCRYCMPAEGVEPCPSDEVLDFPHLLRMCKALCSAGVRRIRLTGGEPLLRSGLPEFMADLAELPQSPEVLLTTNGSLLERHLPALVATGLRRINLSLDTLEAETWFRITRRGGFEQARGAVDQVLAAGLQLKINTVVMPGINDYELDDFVALTRDLPLTVRFIEAMGFDGSGRPVKTMPGQEILARLRRNHDLTVVPREIAAVAQEYEVAGHTGRIGVICGHSRTFCGDCSRLRMDARGGLRTCLYGEPAAELGPLLRQGADAPALLAVVRAALARRHPDGHAAAATTLQSMARIGG